MPMVSHGLRLFYLTWKHYRDQTRRTWRCSIDYNVVPEILELAERNRRKNVELQE